MEYPLKLESIFGTPYFRKPPHTVDGCEILHQLMGEIL